MPFENNVFINCPFDKEYKPILKAVFFCLIYLDFNPLLSETTNSASSRISGIQNLIEKSKYSIHDLSRMKSTRKNELARFNMPFELGMDMGCRRFGTEIQKQKFMLILDKERYRYQQSISDISGNDIAIHDDSPEKAIRQVRNWIRKFAGDQIDSANKIWLHFNEFNGDFYEVISPQNMLTDADVSEMPWSEFAFFIQEWIKGKKK
ncbi:MAG: hypothetical protein H6581_03400 [Bacteroidia bacterium]|nr:hypothetical protein [Bacteroidia bacterium]